MKLRSSPAIVCTIAALALWIPASCLLNSLDSSLHGPGRPWWYANSPNAPWGFLTLRLAHWPSHVFGACGLLIHTKLRHWGAPDAPLPCEFPLVLALASVIGWGLVGMVVGTCIEASRPPLRKASPWRSVEQLCATLGILGWW